MVVEHIKKSYKKKCILNDISFDVKNGECIGILGCNGSGKSTLLNILAGIIKADNGKFLYNDVDLFRDKVNRAKLVGYVPQTPPLLDELSAKDNLSLWYSPSELRKELDDGVLNMLGINEFIKTTVSKMSGGMKKRLSIGCAVAHKPKILLLDEPSAALDLICKQSISNYLTNYKNEGNIVILATHDLQELSLCDKLFVLKNGTLNQITFDGNMPELVNMLKI